MKRITLMLVLTFLIASAAAPIGATGIPGTINLQGRFTDGGGNIVADGVYTVTVRIYPDSTGGLFPTWSETLPVQVTAGLFTMLIGKSTAIPPGLFSSDAEQFLGVTVNAEPEMPRVPLSSVAYSYQTQGADVAKDLVCAGCVSASEVDPSQVQLRVTGTTLPGQYITGINQNGTVTTASDANTLYTAGTGLSLSGNQFSIAPSGVSALEIAANAVGSAEIANGAVTRSELAANAVGTSEVIDGNLTSVDIADEPGVASSADGLTTKPLNSTVQMLLHRAITAPAAGYVLVIATASVTVDHTFGTESRAELGVSATQGDFSSNQGVPVVVSDDAPSGVYSHPATVHGLFAISGGTNDFYFLGHEDTGDFNAYKLQLTVIYIPTAYGTVVATAAPSGGELTSGRSDESSSGLPDAWSEPIQAQAAQGPRQEAVLAGIQQEQAEVNADMAARIEKLEEQLRQLTTTPNDNR